MDNNNKEYNLSMVDDQEMELPPGFRFHPTDEELITHYLSHKYLDSNFNAIAIGEVDLNKIEPWELPRIAKWGEKEWYFFCVRDRKYPTGLRTNRATIAGYWKATGKDKDIYRAKTLVGMKKTLVFYTGRAPKGEKTNWVMHEYRLEGKLAKYNHPNNNVKNEWVISRVFEKNSSPKKPDNPGSVSPEELYPSCLPPLMDSSPYECETKEVFSPKVTNDVNSSYVTCFSSQRASIDQEMADLEFVNSILAQDQPMMKLLLEEKGSLKEETPQEIGLNNGSDMNNNYEFILSPSGSNGLDCLWSY